MMDQIKKPTARRVLLVWELGGGLGHQNGLLTLAREALADGAEVFAAMRQLPSARICNEFSRVRFLRIAEPRVAASDQATSAFPQLLLSQGFAQPDEVRARALTWMELIELIDPKVIAVDHAPFATLAAKLLGVPHMQIGTGFTVPPPLKPMPPFRTWEPFDKNATSAAESAISQALIRVGSELGKGGEFPSSAGELYQGPAILRTLPCLDHYAESRWVELPCAGPGNEGVLSVRSVEWPERSKFAKRAVAYLKADQPQLQAAIQALANLRHCYSHVYVSGAAAGPRANAIENLCINNEPFDLAEAMEHADVVISAGGAATTAQALLRGKPQLILPGQAEQHMTGINIERIGAGRVVPIDPNGTLVQSALSALLEQSHFHERAQRLAVENAMYATGAGDRLWKALLALAPVPGQKGDSTAS